MNARRFLSIMILSGSFFLSA